jgi:predicted metal-dependent phosphoesterase TrpH
MVDLHVHTQASRDCNMSLATLERAARSRGLDAVAITDHNALAGALQAQEQVCGLCIIPGEEVKTVGGEIIGLFLHQEIPPGLTPAETIRRIRAQGGIVYLPHPLDAVRRSTLRPDALEEALAAADVVEVLNARTLLTRFNRQAYVRALALGKALGAGSDAHTAAEVGAAYVRLPPFRGPEEFLQSIRRAVALGRRSSPLVHVRTLWDKWSRR